MDQLRALDEHQRLAELRSYRVLDTAPESAFDDITRIAAQITGCRTALVSLVDEKRQWFKAMYRFEEQQTSRDESFCAHAILQPGVMVVPDATKDARFATNRLVTAEPHIRFYAGAPLRTPSGAALGTLCVIDYEPRNLTADQCDALTALSGQLMKELDLRRVLSDMSALVTGRRRAETPEVLQAIVDRAPTIICLQNPQGRLMLANRRFQEIVGLGAEQVLGRSAADFALPDVGELLAEADRRVSATGETESLEVPWPAGDQARTYSLVKFPLVDWSGAVYAVGTIGTDVTERVSYETRLRHLSEHDHLTGLPNRRRFAVDLDRQLAEARRYGSGGAVLVLDVDHFKHINDSFGHRGGDVYLVGLAERLRAGLRQSDVLARQGGDEFVALLPHAGPDDVASVCAHLLDIVRGYQPAVDGRQVHATVSIGAALFNGESADAEAVLMHADMSMYQAKEGGRDRASLPSGPVLASTAPLRTAVAEQVRAALAEDRFALHGQPIIDVRTGEVAGWEVLVRMVRADGSLVAPNDFLPAAERFDLVQAIDKWVVRRSAAALRTWRGRPGATGERPEFMSLNISAKSLTDPEVLAVLHEVLADGTLAPGSLVVEVTETAAVANLEDAHQFAERLRALGCRFALDDFGRGFASFYSLKRLPLDLVKIDGDFVRCLGTSRFDQLVVSSVAQIAKETGSASVAEHVEDARTLALLREYGVDYAQGFFIDRPRPLGELLG